MPAAPLEISCQEVKQKLDASEKFLFLDCRERDEHQFVHLNSTTLLPMSELAERVSELEPYRDSEIIIHCHHGGRSLKVAQALRERGFAEAKSMAGGIDEWAATIETGLPRY